jgi:hypothetical protein
MCKYYWCFCIILFLGPMMTGWTTIYKSAVDVRSMGEQYDDQKTTMAIR